MRQHVLTNADDIDFQFYHDRHTDNIDLSVFLVLNYLPAPKRLGSV